MRGNEGAELPPLRGNEGVELPPLRGNKGFDLPFVNPFSKFFRELQSRYYHLGL